MDWISGSWTSTPGSDLSLDATGGFKPRQRDCHTRHQYLWVRNRGSVLKISLRVLCILGLAVLSGAWSGQARAWWNNDWSFRKEIDFDLTPAGADIAGPLTDVPVLIRLSLGNFQYFSDANPDGSDLRFVA